MIRVIAYEGRQRCWRSIAETCIFPATVEIDTPNSRYWFCRYHLGMVRRGDLKPPRGEDKEAFLEAIEGVAV